MIKVRVHSHALEGEPPQEFETDNLAQWLTARYTKANRGPVEVYAGPASAETLCDAAAIIRQDAPEYTVLESPGEPVTYTQVAMALFSMVVSMALNSIFAPRTQQPNRTQESSNNQLSNRENRVRVMERTEDIYGKVRSIPTVIMQPYKKYIQNQQVEFGLYCVGRGYYDIPADEVKDGDTRLSQIAGACAAVYAPFTSPNSGDAPQLLIGEPIIDLVMSVARSASVEGIVLKPTNQLQLAPDQAYRFIGAGGFLGTDILTADTIIQPDPIPSFAAVSEVGQTVAIVMDPLVITRAVAGSVQVTGGNTYTVSGPAAGLFKMAVVGEPIDVDAAFTNAGNLGPKTVASVAAGGSSVTVVEALVNEGPVAFTGVELTVDYSGTRTISEIGVFTGSVGESQGYIELAGTSVYPNYVTSDTFVTTYGDEAEATITVDNDLVDWTGWVTLPDTSRTEVWTNVLARNGMYRDDGAKSTTSVEYEVQIEQLTALFAPTGVVETITGTISGATSNERAETLEQITAWAGPARVRVRRTTPFDYDFSGLVMDEITWVDLYGAAPVDRLHFGNKTIIHTITPANARTTALRRRELNCLAPRKLPTYNGTTFSGAFNAQGELVSGTIHATSKIVDILAAITIDPFIGKRNISELDLAQCWAAQQELDAWHPEVAQFNYTLDNDAISFEDTVVMIADAGFCTPHRQNGKIRLAPHLPQAQSSALFTHRNKRPGSRGFGCEEVITRTFANDSEWDGIELLYQDPETETQETIRLPLDGSATRYKKLEIPGIRNYPQAWFRANREYARLRGQRKTIETEVTPDARALRRNVRVDIVDNTRFKSYAGEVLAQDGLTLTLSERVDFLPSESHSIVLMRRNGSIQGIPCTEVSGQPYKVLLAYAPSEAIVTEATPEGGIRTIYSFDSDSARPAMAYLIEEIRPAEGGKYMQLVGVNYSDSYFAADYEPIPDKSGVIFD